MTRGEADRSEQPNARRGDPPSSRVVDASLVVMLVVFPFLASSGGHEAFAVLAVVAVGSVAALYQRGSRAKQISRCAWLLFFAVSVSAYLAMLTTAPIRDAGDAARWAGLVVRGALVLALLGWGFMLLLDKRGPQLADAFDWGAALTIGILVSAGASFGALGDSAAVGALAVPCTVLGMHFVVRERCRSLHRARSFTQIAMMSAIVALVGWAFGV